MIINTIWWLISPLFEHNVKCFVQSLIETGLVVLEKNIF